MMLNRARRSRLRMLLGLYPFSRETVIKLHLILFPWTLWSCVCCCWGFCLPTGYCATWGNRNETPQGKTQLSEIRQLPLLTYVSLSFSPFHFCCHFKVITGCKEESASGVEAKQRVCPQYSAAPRRGTKPSALDCGERNRPSTPSTPPSQCPYLSSPHLSLMTAILKFTSGLIRSVVKGELPGLIL